MILFVVAVGLLRTPVAHMWKLGYPSALFNPIIGALFVAVQDFALFAQTVTRSAAKILLQAFLAVAAAGQKVVFTAGACNSVSFDFLRNRCWIFE
jgi:hypothetical protein